MTRYYEVAKSENSLVQNLELAKSEGYTHIFMWINSDESHYYFAKSEKEAEKEAVELYMTEKKENDKKFAKQYYSEYVDTYEIEDYIDIVNS